MPCVLSYNQRAQIPSLHFQCIWRRAECVETILSYLHFSWPRQCSLEKKAGIYLEEPAMLFSVVSEPVHFCPESFKELTCWVKGECGLRFSVAVRVKIGKGGSHIYCTLTAGPDLARVVGCTANHFKGGLSPTLSSAMACFKIATHSYKKGENSQSTQNLSLQGLMSCLFATHQSVRIRFSFFSVLPCSPGTWPPLDWILGPPPLLFPVAFGYFSPTSSLPTFALGLWPRSSSVALQPVGQPPWWPQVPADCHHFKTGVAKASCCAASVCLELFVGCLEPARTWVKVLSWEALRLQQSGPSAA